MKRLASCVAIVVVLTLAVSTRGREWKDTTGKFSVEAEFAGMEGDSIVKLEKENGEIVKVPLLRLNTKDRKYVEWMIGIETGNALAREVGKAFRWEGDTTVKVELSRKKTLEEFFGRFNGRRVTIRFPIANVSERNREEGVYSLSLNPPRLPANVEYDHGPQFRVPLGKEDALTIGATSVLVVSGKARLNFSSNLRPSYVIKFSSGRPFSMSIILYLDELEYSVESPEAEEPGKKETHAFRNWLDNTGKFTIEAKFSGYALGKVTLEKKDGSKVILPVERLSLSDQKILNALRRKP